MTAKSRKPHDIVFARRAESEILAQRGYEQRRFCHAIGENLRYEPLARTRNRKPLATTPELVPFISSLFPDGAPLWELRIGEWRVAYLVRGQQVIILRVVKKGRKTTGEVLS
jgi:Plasmid stabilisation system protein.